MAELVQDVVACYHCGLPCEDDPIRVEEKSFCCIGCKTVYEILNENDLCEYYAFDKNPGVSLRHVSEETFSYLEEQAIRKKLLEFDSPTFARVRLYIPAIHCISCIWLLENLQRVQPGVIRSEVNFAAKTVRIDYNPKQVSLGKLARLTSSFGYTPKINLKPEQAFISAETKSLVIKLAVAGFAFGNIMLFSFPEYLGMDPQDQVLKPVFSMLNLILAIPVLVYSGRDYLINSWNSLKVKQINIDVPIAAGLLALFLRSAYDIVFDVGPGYMDSLAGLVFFLLIGRWFQSKTYDSLAFDRDYKSYFPLAVQTLRKGEWKPVLVYELSKDDKIRVRNAEVIPADCMLESDQAYIDYSFVTGEAKPVSVAKGELIYAGGRLVGQPVMMRVDKRTSQSHLTSLWNEAAFQKPEESKYKKIIDRVARRFTWIVLGIAVATAAGWSMYDPSRMWLVITSVLMVACPCALALAVPFTYGNTLRVFGRNGFYLKNADVVERMATIDSVVFDKTGTITWGTAHVKFIGALTDEELNWVYGLTSASTHPLSIMISRSAKQSVGIQIDSFSEQAGKGIEGTIRGNKIRVGSASFTGHVGTPPEETRVFVAINNEVRGYFKFETTLRSKIQETITRLGKKCVALLSGDRPGDADRLKLIFPAHTQLKFNQSPHDKLAFVSSLQRNGAHVMMIGDGLNDSGALKQSDVGVAITDDTGVFTPACDGILKGERLGQLDQFLDLSKSANKILKVCLVISFFYNGVALSFAIGGFLTPLIAAILMPLSSISVVGFSTLAVNWAARKLSAQP